MATKKKAPRKRPPSSLEKRVALIRQISGGPTLASLSVRAADSGIRAAERLTHAAMELYELAKNENTPAEIRAVALESTDDVVEQLQVWAQRFARVAEAVDAFAKKAEMETN